MKDVFKLIKIAICIALAWLVLNGVRPYWNKYWIGQTIHNAAIYGTKNSIEDTRRFLNKAMSDAGRDFSGNDFVIEKDEKNTVTISLKYRDEIRVFGVKLKSLDLTVEKTASEVESIF
jgi:hypothetical protein